MLEIVCCLYPVEHDLSVYKAEVHAWDYRRYVLASHPVPRSDENELAYTQKKIEANFSNFSAWHQRSKVAGERINSQEWRDSGAFNLLIIKFSYLNQSSSLSNQRCGRIRMIRALGFIIAG